MVPNSGGKDGASTAPPGGGDTGSGSGGSTSAASRLAAVRVVSAADVAAGRYSVFDLVLPLPGREVVYPAHDTGAFIREVGVGG